MRFAIMLDNGGGTPSILGRSDGTELWFDSLQEVLDFIKKHDIPIAWNSMICEFIGDFVLNEYREEQIRDMLENGIQPRSGEN